MIRFLRLFPAYRSLESQLEESAAARIAAEDSARSWRARAEQAEEERGKYIAQNESTLKRMANYQAIQAGSPSVPFPEVYVAMPKEEAGENPSAVPGAMRSMRQIEQAAVARSRKQAWERQNAAREQLEEAV